MRTFALAALASALLASLPARASSSFRCDGKVIEVGTTQLDLLMACGRASFEDSRIDDRLSVQQPNGPGTPFQRRSLQVNVNTWTYDFGSTRFVMTVTLERGRITAISEGSYGRDARPHEKGWAPTTQCEPQQLSEGMTKADVLSRCGEPPVRETATEFVSAQENELTPPVSSATYAREYWSYNFGPQRLSRHLVFENGVLKRLNDGKYGS
ncbi:MAG: DUF2845 domain-containing protein [Deltaproteobacteria bacterium]|nr:DUF2845 domain-containing protein [Deltaproteobacteria bacterium]